MCPPKLVLKIVVAVSLSKLCCHGLIKIVCRVLLLRLEPKSTRYKCPIEKLKNKKSTKAKLITSSWVWALVQVLPIKHNNFCLTVMNRKLSNGIACNVRGLALWRNLKNCQPVTKVWQS